MVVPRILATGYYVPEHVLTNDELATRLDTSDEWIFSHTGIHQRRIAGAHETSASLGTEAGRRALARAGLEASDLDLVLVATSTPDFSGFPSTASLIQNGLGATKAGAMDLTAACTGFVYALETARAFIASGSARHVLVVGAEVFSRIVDWNDRSTCILFGDGAAAVVVGPGGEWFAPSLLRSDGSGGDALARSEGGFVTMQGRKVYTFAIGAVKDIVLDILGRHGHTLDDVAWIVPHQANVRIVASAAERLGLPLDKFVLNMDRYANTSGASIPLALAELDEQGLVHRGQLIVTVGFGAGLTWGANLFRW